MTKLNVAHSLKDSIVGTELDTIFELGPIASHCFDRQPIDTKIILGKVCGNKLVSYFATSGIHVFCKQNCMHSCHVTMFLKLI